MRNLKILLSLSPTFHSPTSLTLSPMYKYLLQSVEGIQWFGIGTLLLFFCTFCFTAIRAFISNKADMDRMASMPLEKD